MEQLRTSRVRSEQQSLDHADFPTAKMELVSNSYPNLLLHVYPQSHAGGVPCLPPTN